MNKFPTNPALQNLIQNIKQNDIKIIYTNTHSYYRKYINSYNEVESTYTYLEECKIIKLVNQYHLMLIDTCLPNNVEYDQYLSSNGLSLISLYKYINSMELKIHFPISFTSNSYYVFFCNNHSYLYGSSVIEPYVINKFIDSALIKYKGIAVDSSDPIKPSIIGYANTANIIQCEQISPIQIMIIGEI